MGRSLSSITYSNDQNPDQKSEIGQCRPSQKDTIRKAIESVLPYIKTAIDKPNNVLFKKWFGVANGKESDSVVSPLALCSAHCCV